MPRLMTESLVPSQAGADWTRRQTGGPSELPAFKRPLDVIGASLALLAAWPVLLLIALLIRCTSRGPVLFKQTRIGKDGVPFTMLKFRSMSVDSEAKRAALETHSERDGVCFKLRADPRVTPIGRLLRRTSMDELPQIINVLRGDMSLVGPRPGLPQEVAAYSAHARGRLKGLPGITGLWQVSGRAELSFDQMIVLDRAYLETCCLANDLRILFATVGAVVTARGAY